MSFDLPTVTFIDGDPPRSGRDKRRESFTAISPFIVGRLMAEPGRWARVETNDGREGNQVAHKLRLYAEAHKLNIESVGRADGCYARILERP